MKRPIAFAFHRVSAEAGKAPKRFLLLRDGDLGWAGIEKLKLTSASARKIIEKFDEQGVDLPIDYHHASGKVEDGKAAKAPAAGWIKGLEYVPGEGLYASRVEWTAEAKREIESGQYKYTSPSVFTDKAGVVVELHSCALTNRPRTKDQLELLLQAAERMESGKADDRREDAGDEDNMALMSELMEVLKENGVELSDGAELGDVLQAAIDIIRGGGEEATEEEDEEEEEEKKSKKAEADADDEDDEEDEPVSKKARADADKKLNRAKDVVLSKRLARLETKVQRTDHDRRIAERDALIDEMVEAGRLLPDDDEQMDAAREWAERDPENFRAVMSAAQPIVEPGAKVTPKAKGKGARDLVIVTASREYDREETRIGGVSKRAYVNTSLKEKGLTPCTDDEYKRVAAVG